MWLRDPLPIEVSRVASIPIGGQFWDDVANAPMDITGYAFSGSVATSDGKPAIYSFPVSVTEKLTGLIDFSINGAAIAQSIGKQEAVTMSYQIKATDAQGNSVIAARGPLILTPGI